MKPSISIDLPGWCTLQKDAGDSDLESHSEDCEIATAPSTGGHTDLEASDHNLSRNGSVYDDSDREDEDEDEDGSIARLFSLDGLKRTRHASESYSSTTGGERGQMPTSRPIKHRRISNAGVFDHEAEAFVDWACVRCTLINTYDRESCQGCGGANVKRIRVLRERRREVKRLSRLQAARECRDRSLKEEALRDLLEDSDAEDEHASSAKPTLQPKGEDSAPAETPKCTKISPIIHEDRQQGTGKSSSDSAAEIWAAASRSQTTAAHGKGIAHDDEQTRACFVSILPPDLLLQCMEFLGDSKSLCCVRVVSLGWLLALDDRNAGRRLWRPLFYRLRADGFIHAATNTRGQRRRELKLYDLGTLSTMSHGARSAPGNDSNMSCNSLPMAAGSGATPSFRQIDGGSSRSLSCLVCGLIQREGYAGNECEMCASSLAEFQSPAAPPRVAYTRLQLSENCAVSPRPTSLPVRLSKLDTTSTSPTASNATGPPSIAVRDGNSSDLPRKHGDLNLGTGGDEDTDCEDDVDWHFLVKRLTVEKRVAAAWGSLHQGWVWLQGALQATLHRRLGSEPPSGNDSLSAAPGSALGTMVKAGVEGSSCDSGQGASAADASSCHTGREGQSDLEPRIARVVRKLASKKWVVLYESLKTMFTLQAEGIARGVVSETFAAIAVLKVSGKGERASEASEAANLEGLRRCVAAWEAYKDWCEEVDMYCELLNEQISAERYRTAGAGCGRGDHTPFVRDVALLSFRHSFVLNVHVCALLREAIFKGNAAVEVQATGARGGCAADRDARASGASAGFTATESCRASSVEAEGNLFTDLELVEDSRAIDFSVRSFSRPEAGRGAARGNSNGGKQTRECGGGRAFSAGTVRGSRGARPGHYYDWFLSKLEGKEAGIIRGDIDANGKSVARQNIIQEGKGERTAGGEAADGIGLGMASLEELLDLLHDMVEVLDVPDDGLSKDRCTQGVMRRLLLLPIKRWQAAIAETSAEDPRNVMLMAGLSPCPGEEGFHRLREGAAGRRKGNPTASKLGKNAGKSWEKLSLFFG